MKKYILLIITLIYSFQLLAQNPAVLDSLRYYPLNSTRLLVPLHNDEGFNDLYIVMDQYDQQKKFGDLSFTTTEYTIAGGFSPAIIGQIYESADSVTGLIYRAIHSEDEGIFTSYNPMNLFHHNMNIFSNKYHSYSISGLFEDSISFPIERLYFDVKPSIGDTVLKGSARFSGLTNSNLSLDEIEQNDIIVLFKGYREKLDRELGFDNPVDTLFKLLDFEIRYSFTDDSLLSYTLAKDIGLIEASLFYKYVSSSNKFDRITYKLYKFKQGNRELTRNALFVSNETTHKLPSTISISAYPNPFNPQTTVSYSIKESEHVNIEVFNQLGQRVQKLVDSFKQAGNYRISFDASHLSSGMYFIRLQTQNEVQTVKVLLVK